MTAELQDRWLRGEVPFNGVTLTPAEWLPSPCLAAALEALVAVLASRTASPLYTLLDWHEHDGFLTHAEPMDWDDLAALVRAPDALIRAFTGGDTWVYRAFFPEEYEFYLRFYLSNEDGPVAGEWSGTFDLTGPPALIAAAREVLTQNGDGAWRTVPAEAYFSRIYAG